MFKKDFNSYQRGSLEVPLFCFHTMPLLKKIGKKGVELSIYSTPIFATLKLKYI